jgi:hypothetical protein
MTDEIRLQNELTFDEFTSSVGGRSVWDEPKILVLRRDRWCGLCLHNI